MVTKLVDLAQDVKIVSERNYLESGLKMSVGFLTEAFKSHGIRHSLRLLRITWFEGNWHSLILGYEPVGRISQMVRTDESLLDQLETDAKLFDFYFFEWFIH